MQVGVFAKSFAGSDAAAVLRAVRAAGYTCTQFNMACAGLAPMPDALADETLAGIGRAATAAGVSLAAVSATYNMIHPDRAVRDAGIRRLRVIARAARTLGAPLVTLCTGTRDGEDQWRHHPGNALPDAWSDLVEQMQRAVAVAEAEGVDLGIEPEQANVVTSVGDARRLIGALGSPRVRIVLDPANLFEQATPDEARRIVAGAVDEAAGWIAMAHAKDRDRGGAVVAAGQGVVDFPDFLARLKQVGFDGPVVAHGLSAEQAPGVAAYLSDLVAR